MRGFNFFYPNLSALLKDLFQPSQNLLNIESGTAEASTVPTQYSFYPVQQQIEEKIKEYNAGLSKNFINESHFLYDKSGLIKESYITAINKIISLYGSTSYFDRKAENEILKILSPENSLKFLVNKDTVRYNLSFQLANISGAVPTLKDKKIHDLSLTKLGRKRKLPMLEPIETLIIRAQQNFEVVRGLNPVQIKTEDDRILSTLKNIKVSSIN